MKKRTHGWIHITEETVHKLEYDKDINLLENTYDEFEVNNIKICNY